MENRLLREDGIARRDATVDKLKLHLNNALDISARYRYALWAIIECVQYSADSNPVWAQIANKVLAETSDLPREMVQGDARGWQVSANILPDGLRQPPKLSNASLETHKAGPLPIKNDPNLK